MLCCLQEVLLSKDLQTVLLQFLDNKRDVRTICQSLRDATDSSRKTLTVGLGHSQCGLQHLLQRMPHLHSLDLHHIYALAPLQCCTALVCLKVIDCQHVTDLSPLAACSSLTSLELCNSNIADVSALSACLALKLLVPEDFEQLTDLSTLSNCPALESLMFRDEKLAAPWLGSLLSLMPPGSGPTITANEIFHSLASLNVRSARVIRTLDLVALCNLISLHLFISNFNGDLQPLQMLTCVRHLRLTTDDLDSITSMPPLPCLTSLDLSYCDMRSIIGIENLPGLTTLTLDHCTSLGDYHSLSACCLLTELLFCCNTCTSPIPDLACLASLRLDFCDVGGALPWNRLPSLTMLNAGNCHDLCDISALTGCLGLLQLDLSATSVENISHISGLVKLTDLNLCSCHNVCDVKALAGLTCLTTLSLTECDNVSNVAPLATYVALVHLYVDRSGVSHVGALAPFRHISGWWRSLQAQ